MTIQKTSRGTSGRNCLSYALSKALAPKESRKNNAAKCTSNGMSFLASTYGKRQRSVSTKRKEFGSR
jgi:hypothetical protein